MQKQSEWVQSLLRPAGITINGKNPWDIQIKNPAFYNRLLAQGSLGLGESYMEGWWECQALDEFFHRLFLANVPDHINISLPIVWEFLKAKLFNLQRVGRAYQVAEQHYDLGNDFFAAMIGPSMTYTCGYWKDSTDLTAAEFAKLDLICRKLNLQPGQKVLDIGSGWGSFAKYAAEHYGVNVVGVTVSKEQVAFAKEYCKGLSRSQSDRGSSMKSGQVEFRLQDYRQVDEKFDHVVSIGMFEAVGRKNFKTFMQVVRRCLKEHGLFLLHTIGSLESERTTDPWMLKYIFPNGQLPYFSQIAKAAKKLFVIEDVHNFGADYDKTLMAWHQNFQTNWSKFKNQYGETFYRMWKYYLLICAGSFRARKGQLWQIVLSPNGVPGGYKSVR